KRLHAPATAAAAAAPANGSIVPISPTVITNTVPTFTSPSSTLAPDQVDAATEEAFRHLLDVADAFLLIRDRVPIKACLAAVVASQIRHEPVWILLVQPPSSLKTEF